jgi:aminopeptidase N
VRILEFPRYSSFAQSFDNTIPYSEGIGFIANLSEEDAIDYVYFVTAHEMSHQWWGHQINPANVRGAQFLSETMSEYAALMVMRQRYGDELMGRFLRRELNGYMSGRSRETRKEDPLMDIEMQSYAYYRKGSLAMFNVMSLIGEKQMNAFLGNFVSKYRFRERPYPSTLDFQTMLNEKLSPEQRELAGDQLSRITLFKNKVVSARGKKLADGSYEVKVKVELGKMYADSTGKNEKPVPFTGNIQLALLKEKSPKVKSDVLKVERMALKDGQEVRLVSREKPVFAALDPFYTFTDILPEDNQMKIDWE